MIKSKDLQYWKDFFGYPEVWFADGLLTNKFVELQSVNYTNGVDQDLDHYKWGAYRQIIDNNDLLDKKIFDSLMKIILFDKNKFHSLDALGTIIEYKNIPVDYFYEYNNEELFNNSTIQLKLMNATVKRDLLSDGFSVVKNLINSENVAKLKNEIDEYDQGIPSCGIRNADEKFSSIGSLIHDRKIKKITQSFLNVRKVKKVRSILFDKTPEKNWLVPWHQDRTIAVDRKGRFEGYGPWTIKDGIHHVQPPLEVLEQMITFRIHLDDTGEDNGCLKVIPGSHKMGLMTQEEISDYTMEQKAESCICKPGDAVIMRPHILHSSSKSKQPAHRRIVHIEYSSYNLPGKLNWV